MVKRVNAFKSEAGSERLFDTYALAASDEVAAAIRVILPRSLVENEADRHDLSVRMAEDLLISQDESVLKAWAQIFTVLDTEPEEETQRDDNTIAFPPRTQGRPLHQRTWSTIRARLTKSEAAE